MALSQGPSGARALVANVGLRLDSHKVVSTVESAFRGLVVTYRVTRRVFSKSVTSKLHIWFQKILAGSLKTLKVTRISAM